MGIEWAIGAAVALINIAALAGIIFLAKEVGREKALRKERAADWELMKHVQDETNKPLPTDDDDVRDLMDRS